MNADVGQEIDGLKGLTNASAKELLDSFVQRAVNMTESDMGYFAVLNDKGDLLTMLAWSVTAMDTCAMIDQPLLYPVKQTGLWGDAVRERCPVITNDYESSRRVTKKGYPKGHVDVLRHANLPVWEGDRIVGVVGVGNKNSDYTQGDMEVLTAYVREGWGIIKSAALDLTSQPS
ncbi:MAG: GAF domain-containing protein [Pseudomonadota bacterium]